MLRPRARDGITSVDDRVAGKARHMETGSASITVGFVALLISALSLALAAAAFLRTGAQDRLESLRMQQHLVVDQLARSLRERLEDSLVRVKRAQMRLADIAERASEGLHRLIEDLGRQLNQLRRESEEELAQVRTEVSSRALGVQDAISRRLRYVESNIEIIRVRAEIAAADELADRGAYLDAQALLEDGVARTREVKMRLTDIVGDDPAFAPVIDALQEAIHALRVRTADHRRQLEAVLSASDSLLAWLKAREPREPAAPRA